MARRTKAILDEFRTQRWDEIFIQGSPSSFAFWRGNIPRRRQSLQQSLAPWTALEDASGRHHQGNLNLSTRITPRRRSRLSWNGSSS
ncbi:hypothetical protein Trydic_g5340 [Trypoxylus dichotomus]